MNQNLHRIVFNKHRGQRMAVAEHARAQGKSASGETAGHGPGGVLAFALVPLAFCISLALGLVFLASPAAQAQIVADPSAPRTQQPVIQSTANGLPLVNIQTPSAAGVSRNTYSQFDVQKAGVVLNNSGANVQTQIGGFVPANPFLTAGSARVILNEINSSNPTYLNGYVEVAGQRAEVIIANPSGINVNGGGFINASRATLTTGTPIINGGSLDGYLVQRGVVSIDGAGLDASTTDYTGIIARAVQVNAGIWAKELKVNTGASQVDAAQATATPVTGTGTAPAFALDVALLGGMYAGKIMLVGSEAGLGVRNAGVIGATAGNVVLSANGWLSNSGTIQASADMQVKLTGALTNTGKLLAGGNLAAAAASLDASASAQIKAGGSNALTLSGNLNNAGLVDGASTQITATSLVNTGTVQASGVAAASAGTLQISTTGDITNSGKLQANADLTLAAANISNAASAELTGAAKTSLTATGQLTNRGLIDGTNTLVSAATLANIGTGRIYGDQLGIAATTLTNDAEAVAGATTTVTTAAVIAARNRLDLGVTTLSNNNGASLMSVGDMAIGGALDANGQATGRADTITNNGASMQASGSLTVTANTVNNTNAGYTYTLQTIAGPSDTIYTTGVGPMAASAGAVPSPGPLAYYRTAGTNVATYYLGGGLGNVAGSAVYGITQYTSTTQQAVLTSTQPGVMSSGTSLNIDASSPQF